MRGTRRDAAIALGLVVLVALSRIPFATQELWAHDSVLYARALEQGFHVGFDLEDQRPHPPGYILYLAFAWLCQSILGSSANGALVAVSILGSAVGAAAVFLLARRFVGAAPALVAGAGYAFNPLVWTYSEVAYPYTVLGALSASLAAWFWAARAGSSSAVVASLAFGLLSGFRQDLLLLLGPLWLWMVWPRSWRDRALAAVAVGAGALIWFVPTAALSGGVGTYLSALARQGGSVGADYSVAAKGLDALWFNLAFTAVALAWGLLGFAAVLGTAAFRRTRVPNAAFFLLWIAPALALYVLVHIGEWGYVLSVLPGLYVLAAMLLQPHPPHRPLLAARGPVLRAALVAAAIGLVVVPTVVFAFSEARFSAATLARHDRSLAARVSFVRERFDPERTIILAREDYLLVRHYLPEYRAWQYDPQPHDNRTAKRKRAMRATAIVIFTEGLVPRTLDVRDVEAAPGVRLAYVTIEPGALIELYGDGYTVREPQ